MRCRRGQPIASSLLLCLLIAAIAIAVAGAGAGTPGRHSGPAGGDVQTKPPQTNAHTPNETLAADPAAAVAGGRPLGMHPPYVRTRSSQESPSRPAERTTAAQPAGLPRVVARLMAFGQAAWQHRQAAGAAPDDAPPHRMLPRGGRELLEDDIAADAVAGDGGDAADPNLASEPIAASQPPNATADQQDMVIDAAQQEAAGGTAAESNHTFGAHDAASAAASPVLPQTAVELPDSNGNTSLPDSSAPQHGTAHATTAAAADGVLAAANTSTAEETANGTAHGAAGELNGTASTTPASVVEVDAQGTPLQGTGTDAQGVLGQPVAPWSPVDGISTNNATDNNNDTMRHTNPSGGRGGSSANNTRRFTNSSGGRGGSSANNTRRFTNPSGGRGGSSIGRRRFTNPSGGRGGSSANNTRRFTNPSGGRGGSSIGGRRHTNPSGGRGGSSVVQGPTATAAASNPLFGRTSRKHIKPVKIEVGQGVAEAVLTTNLTQGVSP